MNTYLKYTPYVYLIVAIFAIIKSILGWNDGSDEHFLFLGIAVLCVFMFIFRLRFIARIEARNRKP